VAHGVKAATGSEITQSTARAVIDWESFDIGAGKSVSTDALDVGLRSRGRPPYRYSVKVEMLEKYKIEALFGFRLHRRWPKVADALIKA
jgi:hypothetical protein